MDLESATEEQVRLLADARNQTLLTILDDAGEPLHVEELADRLVTNDITMVSSSQYEDQLDQTLLSLHHERLPKLAEVGLVQYDPETNIATYPTSTAPNVEWEDEAMIDALVTHLPTSPEADESGVRVLEDREATIQYGRRLADEADEELFCMYASTDLLGEECIRRAEGAIDRGVTLYMGSQNAEVRELTRKHLPEATFWEPQLDWLNTPMYPRVGRLVLVDRHKVMLAILEEPDDDDSFPGETTLVGDGEDHPLVVLVRDLLGPRLDHLDYQSDEFRNELPS